MDNNPKIFGFLEKFLKSFPKLNEHHIWLINDSPLLFLFQDLNKIPKSKKPDYYYLKVFRPYSISKEDWIEKCPEAKDPRFIFGFGFCFLNDNLEEFLELKEGKENEEYSDSLLDVAASFGSERIFNFLEMNGIKGKDELERRSFCGRNNQIIQKVLNKTQRTSYWLIHDSIKARNYEVFEYLIQEFDVKEFVFEEGISRKFVEKIEFPLFNHFPGLFSLYFDWLSEYINVLQLKYKHIHKV